MPRVKVNADELTDLLEDHSDFRRGFLDRTTGEIVTLIPDLDDDEEGEEELERIDSEPDRYLEIEPIGSHEGFRIMERFVAGLPEGEDRRLLEKALSWRKPFSNFKRALCDMGDLRERWFEFHDRELRDFALRWLEAWGVDAELVSPRFEMEPEE